ncbi:choline sulfate utilization transcriptional regulator [Vibrio viridaestus]|uniref:LysR family transcriptional regulator n=1 Tax=Vibrio viridaestus TaxID=2487322 RepID=A0A3N9TGQ1_9VIBR|nr:LysR substrate-binding domain-containing protein [Vibrio viridaestus]RQW62645.1 LysR family transcriptional regulator [Vibrio viridaestus]
MLYRNDMPNLQILVVFEASARLLSFTAAAKELGTTQSAVSQQVKGLEEWLDTQLFERIYRGVKLTEDGLMLQNTAQKSLGELQSTLAKIRKKKQNKVLRFLTDFAFASYWLMPTLAGFRREHPEIDIRIETSQTPSQFSTQDTDIAILFGDGYFSGRKAQKLFSEIVYPVCSPRLLEEMNGNLSITDLPSVPLLKLKSELSSKWLTWDTVLAQYQNQYARPESLMEFDNYTLVVQAAIAGQGIALAWEPLLNSTIENGLLMAFKQFRLESNNGYYIVLPETNHSNEVQTFMDWLNKNTQ